MPETFLGSKTETLRFLEDRVTNRIGSWKNKFLSQGGKEVLIKAVVQAIPVYAMSCYKFPQSLLTTLTSEFAKFWWRNQDTGKGIHWQSWDKLARRKEDGGLNFRHLEGYNMALLCKQLWRLCTQPNSLLARALKAKYYPREASAYHAKLGQRPSFGWRSILESRSLLCLGLKQEFGNGTMIDLLRDPWIVDERPRGVRLKPNRRTPLLSQLLDLNSDQWNLHSLSHFFEPDECAHILQVKPGGAESSSYFSWIYNNTGVYSVKSGYWLWSSSSLNRSLAIEQKPNFEEIFKILWNVNSSSKIRNFLWRCVHSSLPVGTELKKKRIKEEARCNLCGSEREDVNHLLFQCDLAQEIWSLPSFAPLFANGVSNSLYENLWNCLMATTSGSAQNNDDIRFGPWILWLLWKARNEFIFQNITTSGQRILQKARIDAREWMEHNVKSSSPEQTVALPSQIKWIAPPISYLKCNVDAAWQDMQDRCGVSWILRDNSGAVRLHGIKVYPRLFSALEAEATALVWAMNCVWNMGYDKIIFESDSSTLIMAIQSPLLWPRLIPFTTEIQGIASRRPWNIQFQHISRKKNVAADALAKHVLSFPLYFGSIDNSIPSWFQPSLDC